MKLKTLTALLASVSAVSFNSIPLTSEPNFDEMTLDAQIETVNKMMAQEIKRDDSHKLATTYLRQAQGQVNELMKKAQKAEHETNLDHIKDIRAQIKKLEDHLAILLEATKPAELAMAQFGGTFTASSYWDNNYKDASLDSPRGVINHPNQGGVS